MNYLYKLMGEDSLQTTIISTYISQFSIFVNFFKNITGQCLFSLILFLMFWLLTALIHAFT